RVYIVVAVLLPLLFLAESYFGPLSLFKVQENKEVYHWLANENPGTVVTEIPFSNPQNSMYMLSSIFHRQTLTNGYSGYAPPSYHELKTALDDFPTRAGIRKLYETSDYLILHGDMMGSQEVPEIFRRLSDFRDRLEPWKRFGSDYVYRINVDLRDMVFRRYYTSAALKNHGISLQLKTAEEHPELQQYVSIVFNDGMLQELPLDSDFQKHTLSIPRESIQRGPNRLTFLYAYKRAKQTDERYRIGTTDALSPVDLIVESVGSASGSRARIIVNGRNLSKATRGYNIVVLDAQSGKVDASEGFESDAGPRASAEMRKFLERAPRGKIVVVAARGDVSAIADSQTIDALKTIGASGKGLPKQRASHIVIGVKGAGPGQAIEKTSEAEIRQIIGEEIKGLGFRLKDLTLTPTNP
ncbi:MAG TPA: interleukin-like EMT inducer domain-containing protein, partial [Acidobacteriota bacterium]